jgi:hypothetical protein
VSPRTVGPASGIAPSYKFKIVTKLEFHKTMQIKVRNVQAKLTFNGMDNYYKHFDKYERM